MFNKKSIAALLVVLVLVFGLTACGGGNTTAQTDNSGQTAQPADNSQDTKADNTKEQTADPNKDVLTITMDADPVSFDPALVTDGNSTVVISNTMEGLMGFEAGTGKLIPVLAESYDVEQDGKVVIFHLRKGVKFQDGTPFNADAVKFNMERQMAPNKTEDMPQADTIYGNVDKVEVVDENTVKVTLKVPDVTFLTGLALSPGCEMVSPTAFKNDPEAFKKNPVGTGPYKVEKWVAGQYVSLTANPDYWGGAPKTSKVIYKIIPDSAVRTSELLAGTVDILSSVDINSIDQLKSSGMNVKGLPGSTINYIAFYTDQKPFNDKRVRQAIYMGIDRQAIVTGLYGDNAVLANGIIPPTALGYSKDLKALPYDPEKAKELLKEAGYGDGLSFKLIAYNVVKNYNPAADKLAIAIANELKKINVTVDVVVKPWNEFTKNLFEEKHEGNAIQIGWGSTINDPADFTMLLDSKNAGTGLNFAEYKNDEVDKLIAQAKVTVDPAERAAVYQQIQEIVNDDVPWLNISYGVDYFATRPNVKGYVGGLGSSKVNNVSKE